MRSWKLIIKIKLKTLGRVGIVEKNKRRKPIKEKLKKENKINDLQKEQVIPNKSAFRENGSK